MVTPAIARKEKSCYCYYKVKVIKAILVCSSVGSNTKKCSIVIFSELLSF